MYDFEWDSKKYCVKLALEFRRYIGENDYSPWVKLTEDFWNLPSYERQNVYKSIAQAFKDIKVRNRLEKGYTIKMIINERSFEVRALRIY